MGMGGWRSSTTTSRMGGWERVLLALAALVLALVLAGCGGEGTPTPTPTPTPEIGALEVAGITSEPGYPLTYGVMLNNDSPAVNQTSLQTLARFDVAEIQLEGMIAKYHQNGQPVADGSRTAAEYITQVSQVGTQVGLYTLTRAPSLGWIYNVSTGWVNNGLAAPTATPAAAPTTTPLCNVNDYYCYRRIQTWLIANRNKTVPPPDCSTWGLCNKSEVATFIQGRNEEFANMYTGAGAHTINGDTYASWVCKYISQFWDPADVAFVRDDVSFIHQWSYLDGAAGWDADYNNLDDQQDHGGYGTAAGLEGADMMQADGLFDLYDCLRADGIPAWGNGVWEPTIINGASATQSYPAMTHIDGAMLELTDDASKGPKGYFKSWTNTSQDCTWDCILKVNYDLAAAGKQFVVIGRGNLLASGRWANSQALYLYHLATSLLGGFYFAWGADNGSIGNPIWKNEYWVKYSAANGGTCVSTTTDATGHHWLGTAPAGAKRQDNNSNLSAMLTTASWDDIDTYAWYRVFDKGLAAVNPTGTTKTITLPSGTFKKVNEATSITGSYALGAYEGVVLCNITAMSGGAPPTNTPVPPPTNTPTKTPVPPTNTPIPPTNTPTKTPIPGATNTPVPPTATPTKTPLPPTNTPVPPTATPSPTPAESGILISEVATGGEDSNDNGVIEPGGDQCIELFNSTGQQSIDLVQGTVDLEGWAVYNNDTELLVLDIDLAPGDFWSVFGADWLTVDTEEGAERGAERVPPLQAGNVTLRNASGFIVDTVTLSASELTGRSKVRQNNAGAWTMLNWPTCGFSNSWPTPDGFTPQATNTPRGTPTKTATPSRTPTATRTPTPTAAGLGTATRTPTATALP